MVFVDASVLVAVLLQESDADRQATRLVERTDEVWISAVVRYEVVTSVAIDHARREGRSRLVAADVEGASRLLDDLLTEIGGKEMPVTPEVGRLALDAATRFGKLAGHPARLNMGDCFAHACATSLGVSLLYKGDDFSRTDLA